MKTYVDRIMEQTKTRFWVNNPVPSEAEKGLNVGVYGATSNPTYLSRMLKSAETREMALKEIDRLVHFEKDDHQVVTKAYMTMISKIAEIFLPRFEETNGIEGWVAIQGNPYHDTELEYVINEALEFYKIAPNIVVKLSATPESLIALEKLTKMGHATLGTAGLSISYARAMFEAYQRGIDEGQGAPRLFVTTLAAPFEGYAKKYVEANKIDIDEALVLASGIEMSKKAYRIWEESYSHINCKLMGGGVRRPDHFKEMVGGDMHVTCGWDFIQGLIDEDPEVVCRIDKTVPESWIKELMDKIPAFKNAYLSEGFLSADWLNHAPFCQFRNNFFTAWDVALATVRERRIMMCL